MKIRITALAALLACSAAHADVAITLDAGSTGAGLHLVVPMESDLNGRFGFATSDRTRSKSANQIALDQKDKRQTAEALFDWYPGATPFHATAGIVYNGNEVNATGRPDGNGNYTINGNSYTSAQVGSLTGLLQYRRAAPYVGIGWGNPLAKDRKWHVMADLGVIYQGDPTTTKLVSIGCTDVKTTCDALTKDVAAEIPAFRDEAKGRSALGVARISIGLSF